MFKNSLILLLSRCGAWFLSPPVFVVYSDLLLTNRIMQSSSVWFPKLNRTSHYGFLFVVPLVSLGAWGNQWPCHKNIPAVLHGEEMSLLTKNPWGPLPIVMWDDHPGSGTSGPCHTLSDHSPRQHLDCSF